MAINPFYDELKKKEVAHRNLLLRYEKNPTPQLKELVDESAKELDRLIRQWDAVESKLKKREKPVEKKPWWKRLFRR